MYKVPSARRRKRKDEPLNLVPILDCVFILIFFLLFSADFLRIREITTDLPIVSSSTEDKPPKKELIVTVTADQDTVKIFHKFGEELGDGKLVHSLDFVDEDSFYSSFHNIMRETKEKNEKLTRIILKPSKAVLYKILIKLMDQIRQYRSADGLQQTLFAQILFGNVE